MSMGITGRLPDTRQNTFGGIGKVMATIAGGIVLGGIALFLLALFAAFGMALIDFSGESRSLRRSQRQPQRQEKESERAEFVRGLVHQSPPRP